LDLPLDQNYHHLQQHNKIQANTALVVVKDELIAALRCALTAKPE